MTNLTDLDVDTLNVGSDPVLGDDREVASANGAIASKNGTVVITKGSAAALTLAAPTATTDDWKRLTIVSSTAAAHTITNSSPGFNGGGSGSDVATMAASIGSTLELVAYQGVWLVANSIGITLA